MDAPPEDRSPTTIAVLVGRPSEHTDASGRVVRSAFRKHVVDGPVPVGPTNLSGDEQADLRVHGGLDKAVLAYSADHATDWASLDPALAAPGAFGENLHVAGLTEDDVCIGDRWSVGTAVFEVSQPRQPCWKVNDRWQRDDLVARVETSGWAGWYLRVLQEGEVAAGDVWVLVARPHPDATVAEALDVMHHRRDELDAARTLHDLPELAESWRRSLAKRIERLADGRPDDEDTSARRVGPG